MNLGYNNAVPNGPDDPADDQPQMLLNTNSINSWTNIDHIGFNQNNGGYHRIIHQPTNASSLTRSGVGATYTNQPSNITDVNQIIAGVYTTDATVPSTDTQLFSLTSGNVLSQLTGQLIGTPGASIAFNDGFVWFSGILLQWGFVNTPGSGSFASGNATGEVIFKDRIPGAISFPNNIFNIWAVPVWSSNGGPPATIGAGSVTASRSTSGDRSSKTQFDWSFNSVSTKYVGFTWVAIGN